MTSINAMRLGFDRGLLVSDEARYWNDEWMIFYTPAKMRRIVSAEIEAQQDLVAYMGQTGTSSIGDEWIVVSGREGARRYAHLVEKAGGPPEEFLSLDEVARLTWELICRVKRVHLDDYFRGRYGFSADELVAGEYPGANGPVSLADPELVKRAMQYLGAGAVPEDVKGIFGNSQIVAGWDPAEGFRIFYMTERWPVCEEVGEIFASYGSGRDSCDLINGGFVTTQTVAQRRGEVDRGEALVSMLEALNTAFRLTMGIGGYPKVVEIDGGRPRGQRVQEVFDWRSKLACETVAAGRIGKLKRVVVGLGKSDGLKALTALLVKLGG